MSVVVVVVVGGCSGARGHAVQVLSGCGTTLLL